MAVRCSGDEVKEIIDTTLSASDIVPFITIANLVINEKLDGEGLSADFLKEIERWLSAHYVAIRDPRLSKVKVDDIEETYFLGKGDKGLGSTPYGVQVLAMDTTGILKDLGKKKVIFTSIDLGLD